MALDKFILSTYQTLVNPPFPHSMNMAFGHFLDTNFCRIPGLKMFEGEWTKMFVKKMAPSGNE